MEKLKELRSRMKAQNLDAYIVTGADAHGSGYVTDYWKTRAWLTGFTGSNGIAVITITPDEAGLWTDGRYFLQAEKELPGSGFTLFKMNEPDVPTYQAFLKDKLPKGGRIGFDGRTLPVQSFDTLKKQLKEKEASFTYTVDLVGEMWVDRPTPPVNPAFAHEIQFTGLTAQKKLALVREQMKEKELGGYILTALDDIAWLLNIRGSDVAFTPVVYAYAFITATVAHVFIEPEKIKGIELPGFTVSPYTQFNKFLRELKPTDINNGKLYYNPNKANVLIGKSIPESIGIKRDATADIVPLLKAKKSEVELTNIRNAYIKEGTCWVRLFMWLEAQLAAPGDLLLHESDIAQKLTELRGKQPHYIGDSFSTIAAYGPNAASAHYNPGPKGAEIKQEGFLLIDSGGQYLDGTTDTTRTIPVGELTDEMRRDFTLVLKGHIALTAAVFPTGTTGSQLDVLARLALWKDGKNFRHGTGHGIGYVLSVHEGPHSIADRFNAIALAPGMLASNEPGMYKDNHYGIRTENIICVKALQKTEYGQFLGFESLTFCPINTKALDVSLLNEDERNYLNDYHKKTYEALAPNLNNEEQIWLQNATREI